MSLKAALGGALLTTAHAAFGIPTVAECSRLVVVLEDRNNETTFNLKKKKREKNIHLHQRGDRV